MVKIKILDDTLRDGQHALSHQFTPDQVAEIAGRLDKTGVDAIEVGHGNGLSGSSCQYGIGYASDEEYLTAAASVLKHAKLAIIVLPGIGTRENFEMAKRCGVQIVRVSTQITEADIAMQHIEMAKKMGFETRAILTQAQVLDVEATVRQAKLMESYGADVVYLFDGSGYMLPGQIRERFTAMKEALNVPIGFHGHNNLQLALANSLVAIECGAEHIDTCLKGFGAGAGNCPTELLVAAANRLSIETGIDLFEILNIGDELIVPLMPRPMDLTSDCLMLGYAGVYSSFRLFAQRAAEKYGVDSRKVIAEVGARKCTEGQEDLCIDVAYEMSKAAKEER
ncbi:4-hydroxy-2-oxovalerate aldolase [Sediminispirochaeta smaragdinae]|jgi:4-hydroxy 2-oxovalerate aldolase|uniref:4-hydroxy-2-oxovalerate aldolase n=1 Tax=Sediminispirochaeta smaragdinae (strain DSM 11293 / JCM 15392 / SEBR 4228) TaxID=573413 RepID=E1R9T2_SEDSS|nr:4-hydroxy-2-oxovalerate aldolase [Sediminispirochaeta smaragdinae]ADK83251.1 4-hydroxy-2-oxovalerate aldolase [Sediminispirochaeta smaragdinae DSM 11293]